MSIRAAGGKKRIKKCGQALFIDGGAFCVFNSVCNSQNEYYLSWVGLLADLRQLFCSLLFVIGYHSAGTACGFHIKPFSKQFTGSASQYWEMNGMLPDLSFLQNINGEQIKMKFETSNLRSCTDEDDYENAEYGMRAVALRQRSLPLTIGGINVFRTGTAAWVHQKKAGILLTAALSGSSSLASHCPHGAERRGCA